jgi:alginate O-acetyltransferase complex protein AlgI
MNRPGAANPFLRGLRVFATLHLVLFGWIIFRSDSWGTFTGILHSLFQLKAGAPNVGIALMAVMAAFYAIHFTPIVWKDRLKSAWAGLPATMQGLIAACVTLFLYNIGIAEVKPFIYFQF